MLTKADLQRLRSLRDKKNRESLGLFVVEGAKVVGELLVAGFPFTAIYVTEEWTPPVGDAAPSPGLPRVPPNATRSTSSGLPAGRGAGAPRPHPASVSDPRFVAAPPPPIQITAAEMARASHFPTPSSILAVGRIARPGLTAGALDRGLTLALDAVQDPGNVGTLLRIADWFGFDRVLLSADSADLFHQKVINASMGSFARVAVHTGDLAAALAAVGPATPILGCDLAGEDVHTLAPLSAAVVVIGNEGRGISPDVAARLTRRVTISRYGQAESLNAAVAAGIVCAVLRQPAR